MDELNCRPSSEEVLNRVADKLEKEGVLPSGQDIVSVVLEKLKSEQVLLHPYNKQMYITKVIIFKSKNLYSPTVFEQSPSNSQDMFQKLIKNPKILIKAFKLEHFWKVQTCFCEKKF